MNTFNEKTHTYHMNGVIVPSTSRVLECNAIGFELNRWLHDENFPKKTKSAQELGTNIHDLMDRISLGEIVEYPNKMIEDMCEYGKKIISDYKIIGTEKPLFSDYGFGGKPDLWGIYKSSKNTVIDYKSNDQNKAKFKQYNVPKYEKQLGAYYLLLMESENFEVEEGVIIHLPTKMTYIVDVQESARKFLRLLDIYNGEKFEGVKISDVVTMWNSGMSQYEISNIMNINIDIIKYITLDFNKILQKV